MSLSSLTSKIRQDRLAKAKGAKEAIALKDSQFVQPTFASFAFANSESENPIITDWRSEISKLPPSAFLHGERLLASTIAFLDSEHATQAIDAGWDEVSLFGIHSSSFYRERRDAWGLVPLLSWSLLELSLTSISSSQAHLVSKNAQGGSKLQHPRSRAGSERALAWWRHPMMSTEARS